MSDCLPSISPRPWNLNSPDETLILGANREVVATTLQDEEDYQENYDRRSSDAEHIVKCVNSHDEMKGVLRDAYTILAFCFRRIEPSARTSDGELCRDIGKVRGKIEKVFSNLGSRL